MKASRATEKEAMLEFPKAINPVMVKESWKSSVLVAAVELTHDGKGTPAKFLKHEQRQSLMVLRCEQRDHKHTGRGRA